MKAARFQMPIEEERESAFAQSADVGGVVENDVEAIGRSGVSDVTEEAFVALAAAEHLDPLRADERGRYLHIHADVEALWKIIAPEQELAA